MSDPPRYYNPWKPFSVLHYVNDVPGLPESYKHEFTGWTVDGAIAHRDRPGTPWRILVELNLEERVLLPVVEDKLRTQELIAAYYLSTLVELVDAVSVVRDEERAKKNFATSDRLRDVLKGFGVSVGDRKVTA